MSNIQAYKANKQEGKVATGNNTGKQGAQTRALRTSSQASLYISGCTACLTTMQLSVYCNTAYPTIIIQPLM